jgi:hypothetical protein
MEGHSCFDCTSLKKRNMLKKARWCSSETLTDVVQLRQPFFAKITRSWGAGAEQTHKGETERGRARSLGQVDR